MVRIIVVLVVVLLAPRVVVAQDSHFLVGGSINLVTQTHADDQPVGGTKVGGSAVLGVWVSPRVAIELEPSLAGSYSSEYTYRPSPSLVATVLVSRQETVIPVQARFRVGAIEPVLGVGVVRGRIARDATLGNGAPYFSDSRTDNDLALVAGLDAPFKLASRLHVVPTFRMLAAQRGAGSIDDPLGEQTRTGTFTFRYGVGIRAAF